MPVIGYKCSTVVIVVISIVAVVVVQVLLFCIFNVSVARLVTT